MIVRVGRWLSVAAFLAAALLGVWAGDGRWIGVACVLIVPCLAFWLAWFEREDW